MAPSKQTPNGTRNGARTPPLATYGTQNNFRADGRDEGTVPFDRSGSLRSGGASGFAATDTQHYPPRAEWNGPQAVSGNLFNNNDPFVSANSVHATNGRHLNAAAVNFQPTFDTSMAAARLSSARHSTPLIANGSGENIMSARPYQPIGTSAQLGPQSSHGATSPTTVTDNRYIKVVADSQEKLEKGKLSKLMSMPGWKSFVENDGCCLKSNDKRKIYIFSSSLEYARSLVAILNKAGSDRSVQASFIHGNEFAAATGDMGPQTDFPGELHIDVQHTGRIGDFEAESLKKKVKDFLLGMVIKHHNAIKREIFIPNDPESAFKAFDISGTPTYPAIHFHAVCDEVSDAQYLIDQLQMGSSSGEATFSDLKIVVTQYDPDHFKMCVRDSNAGDGKARGMSESSAITNGMNSMSMNGAYNHGMFANGMLNHDMLGYSAYGHGRSIDGAFNGAAFASNANGKSRAFHTPHASVSSNGSARFISKTGRTQFEIQPDGTQITLPGLVRPGRIPRPSQDANARGSTGFHLPDGQHGQSMPDSFAPSSSSCRQPTQPWQHQVRTPNRCGPNAAANGSPSLSNHRWKPQDVLEAKVNGGIDIRTTLMIRNVPTQWGAHDLVNVLNSCVPGRFDFTYVRMDFQKNQAVGYAFANFTTCDALADFITAWVGRTFPVDTRFPQGRLNRKPCEVSYANTQGRECLIKKFRNSSIMDEAPGCRPKLWSSTWNGTIGHEEEFPGVDNQAKHARSAENAEFIGLYTKARNGGRRGHSQFDRGTSAQIFDEQQLALQNAAYYGYQNYVHVPGAVGSQSYNPHQQFPINLYASSSSHNNMMQLAPNPQMGHFPSMGGAPPMGPALPMAHPPQAGSFPPMAPVPQTSPYNSANNMHINMHLQQGPVPAPQHVPFGTGPNTPASRMRTQTNGRLGGRVNIVAAPTSVDGTATQVNFSQYNSEHFGAASTPFRYHRSTPRSFQDRNIGNGA